MLEVKETLHAVIKVLHQEWPASAASDDEPSAPSVTDSRWSRRCARDHAHSRTDPSLVSDFFDDEDRPFSTGAIELPSEDGSASQTTHDRPVNRWNKSHRSCTGTDSGYSEFEAN